MSKPVLLAVDDDKEQNRMATSCKHVDQIQDVTPSAKGCEEWRWCYLDQGMV